MVSCFPPSNNFNSNLDWQTDRNKCILPRRIVF